MNKPNTYSPKARGAGSWTQESAAVGAGAWLAADVLREWKRQFPVVQSLAKGEEELQPLRREVEQLKQERNFLKQRTAAQWFRTIQEGIGALQFNIQRTVLR